MATCKPAIALGTPALRMPRADHEQGLRRNERSSVRRSAGKLHWLRYTRLEICNTTIPDGRTTAAYNSRSAEAETSLKVCQWNKVLQREQQICRKDDRRKACSQRPCRQQCGRLRRLGSQPPGSASLFSFGCFATEAEHKQ